MELAKTEYEKIREMVMKEFGDIQKAYKHVVRINSGREPFHKNKPSLIEAASFSGITMIEKAEELLQFNTDAIGRYHRWLTMRALKAFCEEEKNIFGLSPTNADKMKSDLAKLLNITGRIKRYY